MTGASRAADAVVGVTVGTCVRPIAGETVAGDACVSLPWARGVVVALVDGLGHGERAAIAARTFIDCVAKSVALPLDAVFSRAHVALVKTRGAVAAVARFDEARGEVEIGSIGNVTTVLYAAAGRPVHPLATRGVLGSAYRPPRLQVFTFGPADMLLMHSDGVHGRFDVAALAAMTPELAAEAVVERAARASDDAACLVARGAGRAPVLPVPSPDTGDVVMILGHSGDPESAAEQARVFGRRLGLSVRAQWEVSIAVSELATNVVKLGGEGRLELRRVAVPREAMELVVTDGRTGIADLGAVHRMMDHVEVSAGAERGTRILARKYR